ncbi:type IV secretory system conjugative DNA transfer family protein [Rhodopirellula bahusiensis]|uniref:type IV secretory system conjugative DNA transfer family protein n=3 Tax=Rhodopirellula bahusiensis TaxID=2014065 RepID=UPI0032645CBC
MNLDDQPSSGLLDDLPRGRHVRDIGQPPNNHFESIEDVLATRSLRFDPVHNEHSKIFLGLVDANLQIARDLSSDRPMRYLTQGTPIGIADDRHVCTVAGSRAGKGRSCLVPNALLLPAATSLVCVDPKGDIARLTANFRAKLQQTYVLDPFDISGEHTRRYRCVYNALDVLLHSSRSRFVPDAKLIADSLIVSGDFKDKHWDECSRAMLGSICAHVASHVNYQGRRDLVTVWQLASELGRPHPEKHGHYLLEAEMLGNDAGDGMVRAGARAFYDRTGGEFSSVLSNLRKHLDWISIGCTHDVLRGDSIDLSELKRRAMSLYVTLPALRMADLSGWLRLVIQMAFAACEYETQSFGHQTVFMLDEFSVLGRLKSAETAIAQLAGMGVKCWIVVQDLTQLKKHYKESWETFIANSGVFQFFGGADQTTLEYVSKMLGEAAVLTRSANSPTFNQAMKEAATGASWSVSTKPLLNPTELAAYFSRDDRLLRQLIIRPGYRPMITQRAFYDRHELFQGKFWTGERQ